VDDLIMYTGFSAKTKDKRVDKILIKHGYNNCEIFYSPIFFLDYFVYFLVISLPITYQVINYWYYLPGYIAIGYLISAYLNNCFVITGKELLVINPNFPFDKFNRYEIENIEKIKIDKNNGIYFLLVFLIIGNNYVQINSGGKRKKYYCSGLEIDAYDENLTEKTLDDFSFALSKNNIVVEFKID
jgi:hypothetical protein